MVSFIHLFTPKNVFFFSSVCHLYSPSHYPGFVLSNTIGKGFLTYFSKGNRRKTFIWNLFQLISCYDIHCSQLSSKHSLANALWSLSLFRPHLGRYLRELRLALFHKWSARRSESVGLTAQQNVCRLWCTTISVSSSGISHVCVMS